MTCLDIYILTYTIFEEGQMHLIHWYSKPSSPNNILNERYQDTQLILQSDKREEDLR